MASKQLSKEELFKKVVLEIEGQKILLDVPIQNHFKGERISKEMDFLNGERLTSLDKSNFDYYYWNKYLETVEEVKQSKSIGEAITKLKALVFHFNEIVGKQYLIIDASYYDDENKLQIVNFAVSNSKVGEWINSKVKNPLSDKIKKLEELKSIFQDDLIRDAKEENSPSETETNDNEKKMYSFNDWIKNEFVFEKGVKEKYVFNDSEEYLKLVFDGKMTYEVLNEIQDAQSKTYEYLIKCTLEANESNLKKNEAKSPDFKQFIEFKIRELTEYIEKNSTLYREVITPHLHREIKKGAKYILPEQYLDYKNSKHLDAYLPIFTTYFLENDDGNKITPEINQVHAKMEVNVRWLEKLKSIRDNNYNLLSLQNKATKEGQQATKKFIIKEYALAYIFDLYANGKQIPTNRTDGGYNKKELIQIGFNLYQLNIKKDTFYRAVKDVAKFDLNRQQDLVNISKGWLEAVHALSKDWVTTKKYLIEKKLIGE